MADIGWLKTALSPDGAKQPLRAPLRFEYLRHPDGVELSAPSAHASGIGDDWSAALKDLRHTVWDLHASFRQAPDKTLQADALELKRRLIHHLG